MGDHTKVKKILYVLDIFPKLSETFVLNEMVELTKRGHEIKIFSLSRPNEKITNNGIKEFNFLEKTLYPQRKHIIDSIFNPKFYYYLWLLLSLLASRENRSFMTKRRILKIICLSAVTGRFEDCDIIHSHFAWDASLYGLLLGEALGKPFTFTAHAHEIFRDPDVPLLRRKMKQAACVITPSMYNKKYLEELTGIHDSNIHVIRATIDADKFIPSKRTSDELVKILAVGRLVEKKGFEYLIKCIKYVLETHQNIVLIIAGGGPLMAPLKTLVIEEGLQFHVNLVGAVTNEECRQLIQESTINVLPCIVAQDGDRDVCPLTLQEAMAMGKPVISTYVGSIPELIDDGVNGILVQEKDEKALAHAIITLIENPDLRRRCGKNGREKIIKEFNIKVQVDRLSEIWEKIARRTENGH